MQRHYHTHAASCPGPRPHPHTHTHSLAGGTPSMELQPRADAASRRAALLRLSTRACTRAGLLRPSTRAAARQQGAERRGRTNPSARGHKRPAQPCSSSAGPLPRLQGPRGLAGRRHPCGRALRAAATRAPRREQSPRAARAAPPSARARPGPARPEPACRSPSQRVRCKSTPAAGPAG